MVKVAIHEFAPAAEIDDAQAMEQFQKQWRTYQKLVDSDALSHREVAAQLHAALRTVETSFSILDIACGDAGEIKHVLADTKVSHYHGIDLSEPALELAARNLEDCPFQVDLDHGDYVEMVERRPDPADIAWCGLSIHHLKTDRKRDLLTALRKTTDRFVMIYEPTLKEGETRDGYLERFGTVNRPAWTFLTDEEWRQISNHVTQCDLPETAETWLALGREAGFAKATEIFHDRTDFYSIYRYDV
ncbi:hypothetical protein A7A08_01911 [Methyloligella halotolerans]|uniref:Methyltransferase domain-containing protein n=1 Tax=Methyloligella halotolerans TaxID=1177755 RepID=A0A1E2RYH5_9HYPH|nr:class I SAM-dependent methyltransferase [Methyloligella halotolerans]ODA67165.1 hypothetical protein A7A08_01911 [Methyloligella halotolerans]